MDSRQKQMAEQLASDLGIDPLYLVSNTDDFNSLNDSERQLIFSPLQENTIAFTHPVADLMFKDFLRYDWVGRGCCVIFRQSPLTMSDAEFLGVLVHEMAHYASYSNRPERDDTDAGRAVKSFWKSLKSEDEHHTPRWLRATVHLWWRACSMGYEIPIGDVVNLEQYGFTRDDLLPLLAEAGKRENESIESILRSHTPILKQAKTKKRTKSRQRTTQPSSSRSNRTASRGYQVEVIGGRMVKWHTDGKVETLADENGKGAVEYDSLQEYLTAHPPLAGSPKKAKKLALAKLRYQLQSQPWAIETRALGALSSAVQTGDIEAARAMISLAGDIEPTTKIVNDIAIIPVTGVLRDDIDFMVRWGGAGCYKVIERDFNQAIDNTAVRGVLFYFDTPGGSAIGCKRVADQIFDAQGIKPIRAYCHTMCASAGYYLAAACDHIEAAADALVGSTGTIFPHQEYSGMLKEAGIGAKVFTNKDSPKKGHGNIYEPLSDEAKKTLQQFVDSYGHPFIEDVARYRGVSAEDVIANYGQGDAMRADEAIKHGVVDAVVEGFSESLESLVVSSKPKSVVAA